MMTVKIGYTDYQGKERETIKTIKVVPLGSHKTSAAYELRKAGIQFVKINYIKKYLG